jgi:hypothetical protein
MIRITCKGNVYRIKHEDEAKAYARAISKQRERERKRAEHDVGQVIDLVIPNQKPEHLAAIAEGIEKQKRLDALRDQYREASLMRAREG